MSHCYASLFPGFTRAYRAACAVRRPTSTSSRPFSCKCDLCRQAATPLAAHRLCGRAARTGRPRPLSRCGCPDVARGAGGVDTGPDTSRVMHCLGGSRWPARVFTRALARARRARAEAQKKSLHATERNSERMRTLRQQHAEAIAARTDVSRSHFLDETGLRLDYTRR